MRHPWLGIGGLVTGVLLAACTGPPSSGPTAPTPSVPVQTFSPATDPVALLGTWVLAGTGANGQAGLRLGPGELRVLGRCGKVHGHWRANGMGQFLGAVWGWSTGCETELLISSHTPDSTGPGWVEAAVAFRVQGDERLLIDAHGQVVARLVPGWKDPPGQKDPGAEQLRTLLADPDVIDEFRRTTVDVAPLPDGLTPGLRRDPRRPLGAGGQSRHVGTRGDLW